MSKLPKNRDHRNKPTRREFLAVAGGALAAANLAQIVMAENKIMNDVQTDIKFLENYSTTVLESALALLTGSHFDAVITGPGLAPRTGDNVRIAGYAVTSEFSTDPDNLADGRGKRDNLDYWEYVVSQSGPRIAVSVDVSRQPGTGSSWGQLNGHIHGALGCSGVLTNGGVRDIDVFSSIGFKVFSGSLTVAHGNPHFVSFGESVMLYGARIASRDIVVADCHGAIVIPQKYLANIKEAADETLRRVQTVADYCRQPGFTPRGLLEATKKMKPATPWKPAFK